ncbi:DNA polymerase III subunit delta' [Mitsuaria sp. GD03876]|uniref:DNA polymerase III subunit delta' n=1 Tax=Mitsuaria sp. GD03876 TaxID=2975399 RepID=UPI0024492D05|nr:DNA polymerase III subunit delta' [Mitsuaria sp. GD03876]MDH0867698.1 DNA polymerase III subunit delta' [Mitsuaria sp. GD03876]
MVTAAIGADEGAALADGGQLPLPWLAAPLHQALTQGRSHALLLQGPAGVGQFDLALLLAQAWLCEGRAGTDQPGCGRCPSCHLLRSRSHPDFQVLLPEALREPLGFGAMEAEGEGGGAKASKTKPSREIKIEAVRQMLSFAQVSAARGKAKVVVVYPAEALNMVAANALLKTLEEPAGLLRFVLASAAPQQLLPTIRSRCQPLQMALPARDAALAWLAGQGVDQPGVLLDATGGRPQEALQWSEEGIAAKTWLELPRRIAKGEASALTDWPVPRSIAAMQRLVHDLMRIAHGAGPAYFPRDALPKLPAVRAALEQWAKVLQQAARHADHPLNAGLLMESLVAQGQQAMRPAR